MKTIEEKAKAYDESLERAKQIRNGNPSSGTAIVVCEQIFPELRESEDERSRKWILEYLYDGLRKADEQFKDHFKSAIDWLEKQKEPYDPEDRMNHPLYLEGFDVGRKVGQVEAEQKPTSFNEPYNSDDYEVVAEGNATSLKRKEHNSAWSEEDEETIHLVIEILKVNHPNGKFKTTEAGTTEVKYISTEEIISRIKSLRPPKDCSDCSKHLQGYIDGRGDAEKKLLDEYGILIMPEGELHMKARWKPSEEHMSGLKYFLDYHRPQRNAGTTAWKEFDSVDSLYNDLLKLKSL